MFIEKTNALFSQLKLPDAKLPREIHLKADKGEIDVFLCPDDAYQPAGDPLLDDIRPIITPIVEKYLSPRNRIGKFNETHTHTHIFHASFMHPSHPNPILITYDQSNYRQANNISPAHGPKKSEQDFARRQRWIWAVGQQHTTAIDVEGPNDSIG